MDALCSIGLQPRLPVSLDDFADAGKREDWRNRNILVFPLWDPANPIRSVDVFIDEPVAFGDLLADAVIKDMQGLNVRIASIPHLIEMKRRAGRLRDLDDIDKLQQILDSTPELHR